MIVAELRFRDIVQFQPKIVQEGGRLSRKRLVCILQVTQSKKFFRMSLENCTQIVPGIMFRNLELVFGGRFSRRLVDLIVEFLHIGFIGDLRDIIGRIRGIGLCWRSEKDRLLIQNNLEISRVFRFFDFLQHLRISHFLPPHLLLLTFLAFCSLTFLR